MATLAPARRLMRFRLREVSMPLAALAIGAAILKEALGLMIRSGEGVSSP